MRVVAGSAKGLKLVAPEGQVVRPTSDRVKEAVFGSLTSLGAIEDAKVLDLFAGTGALGIEALSRGAASAVLVETNRAAREAVVGNLDRTGLAGKAELVAGDALSYLTHATGSFDLVLLDPPYGFEGWAHLLAALEGSLSPGAVVVMESGDEIAVPERWHVERDKRYGGTFVRIATMPAGPSDDPREPS